MGTNKKRRGGCFGDGPFSEELCTSSFTSSRQDVVVCEQPPAQSERESPAVMYPRVHTAVLTATHCASESISPKARTAQVSSSQRTRRSSSSEGVASTPLLRGNSADVLGKYLPLNGFRCIACAPAARAAPRPRISRLLGKRRANGAELFGKPACDPNHWSPSSSGSIAARLSRWPAGLVVLEHPHASSRSRRIAPPLV